MNSDWKKENLPQWIEENKTDFLAVERRLWEQPELGMEEHLATKLVTQLLQQKGFEVKTGVAGMPTAFVATWGEEGPVLGFTAEYDALPGLSQQENRVMRAPIRDGAPGQGCGHNLMAVGGPMAAAAVKNFLEQSGKKAQIKIFGTPAEEIMIGKPFLAREGYFDDVDVFLDWHSWNANLGDATFNNGYFNMQYHFTGITCHGNAPWFGKSTLDAAMLTAHAIELLREHLPPGGKETATTINYALPDVGNAFPNVIPDRTTLWVIGRGENADLLRRMMDQLNECAGGCAKATGTQVTWDILTAVPNMFPNETLSRIIHQNFTVVGAPKFTEQEQQQARAMQRAAGVLETGFSDRVEAYKISGMSATDASQCCWFAPYGVAQVQLTPSPDLGWHNWRVAKFAGGTAGQKTVVTAAKVLAATAFDLIENQELIVEAQEEQKQRSGGVLGNILLSKEAKPPLDIHKSIMEKFR